MHNTAISDRPTSSAAAKQLDVYLLVYVTSQPRMPDWSLWICYDDKAVPRLGMRIRLAGYSQNHSKKDIDPSYDLDADKRSKQVVKLGSVDRAVFTHGPQACDDADGCIERHEAEAHLGTQACDGTDGCIERHKTEGGPGTQACDGTDGCIERHRAEIQSRVQACDGTDGCIERYEADGHPEIQACDSTAGCIERQKSEGRFGTQACDGTDGCMERHLTWGAPGIKACDGTEGCIERHRNELEKLALSIPGPEPGFTGPVAEHDNSPVKVSGFQPWLQHYLHAMVDMGTIDQQAQSVTEAAPVA